MIALIVIAFVAGTGFGWFVRGLLIRQMWKASLRFRKSAMGFSRMKGGDNEMP